MADITMTYSAMSEAAGKIRSAESELIQAVANINSALSALGGGYSGQSYEAFRSAWGESEPKVKSMIEAVGQFAPGLEAAAERQKETELANANTASGLAL